MSWAEFHNQAQLLAVEGHDLARKGERERAHRLFSKAAILELRALDDLGDEKPRTLGITAVSAAALFFKSGDLRNAAVVSHAYLSRAALPSFAAKELRAILQATWNEETRVEAGTLFSQTEIIVSVRGEKILEGGAPLDLVLSKVQLIQSMFFRTAELLVGLPFRLHGGPTSLIQDNYRPWLFQSVPGSYQFTVAIERPVQAELFDDDLVGPDHVTDKLFSIVRDLNDRPADALVSTIEDPAYRTTFMKLTRDLSPTGHTIDEVAIRHGLTDEVAVLVPASRKELNLVLRPASREDGDDPKRVRLQGVLRALDLNKGWLELSSGETMTRVTGLSDTVDDVIGPMVNHRVTVEAERHKRGLTFIDIERDE